MDQTTSTERGADRATASPGRHGVLLANLGSPEAPTRAAVRRFLAEFLGDPMVVDSNRLVWWLVRNLFVLPFRGRSSARLYRSIWTEEGSPLIVISRRLRDRVADELAGDAVVELAMRYGQPSIERGLRRLVDAGCRHALVLSMFPQTSKATTGTVEREANRAWQQLGVRGELSFVQPYFAHRAYVTSLASGIRAQLERGPVDHVVLSFHGVPVRHIEQGDPYRDHCEATAAALAAELALAPGAWTLAYQSRFGGEAWLEPNTVDVVTELARHGSRVLIACPGFPTDCLETLEEIDQRLRADFEAAGGAELRVVPCLNDDAEWVRGVASLAREHIDRA